MAVATDEAVLGLFEHPDGVADALDALRAAGYKPDELTVLSDSPYPEGAFDEEPVRHNLHVYPTIGAVCGVAVGLLVTVGTQLAYPLVTGGKPLLSIPPMLVILYCAGLLGAMIVTAFGVVAESRLPDVRPLPYDSRISQGYLGLRVAPLPGGGRVEAGRDDAARLLRAAGAVDLVTGGGATGGGTMGADAMGASVVDSNVASAGLTNDRGGRRGV